MKKFAAVILGCMMTAGCVTVVDPVTRNLPLKMAMTEPVDALETRAATGDRQAQYAVSFLAAHGLRGVTRDPIRAEGLRAQAGQMKTTTQPIYVPGVNGGPGSLIYAQHADPGVSDTEARRLDLCAFTVILGQPAMGGQVCGSPAAYIDLLPSAVALRAQMAESAQAGPPPVDPQSISECAAVESLWSDAARRMGRNDRVGAALAADRIIALCGQDERAWHARVMRATLALADGDGGLALALMEPVPSPPPYPIGAYGELVRIAALNALSRPDEAAMARTALAAASLAALKTKANFETRNIETRPLDTATLVIIDRPRQSFPNIYSLKTLVIDGEPARLEAYQLTRHGTAGSLEGSWFLDAFNCAERATIEIFEHEPTNDQITARLKVYRANRANAISRTVINGATASAVCQWPAQVAPGLGDDGEIRLEYRPVL
ncbi:hypothetical protein KOAAANKH_01201 [Brevundimonas sp. NIBR10]|uniref:hypothetical protein n=1 Tax=Brevundimonas sp. NIBR10 TaxID=3015997 RepID=UPI0022F1CACE|nr:hypothetical protein [Brevundimonas sp. NIBR10]WGM46333.1 hypothetical protein KOAAANKH_01201 [Brevundimonas sp. NIBR10]